MEVFLKWQLIVRMCRIHAKHKENMQVFQSSNTKIFSFAGLVVLAGLAGSAWNVHGTTPPNTFAENEQLCIQSYKYKISSMLTASVP